MNLGLGVMTLLGFDFPGGFRGISDFTCGFLLKLVLWILYISSEGVSIHLVLSYHPDNHLLHHVYQDHHLLHVDKLLLML